MALSREVRVGLFLVVAFLILIALFEVLGKETIFARMVEYKTSFKSIPSLKLGDPVRLAGVDVGSVRDIRDESRNERGITFKHTRRMVVRRLQREKRLGHNRRKAFQEYATAGCR